MLLVAQDWKIVWQDEFNGNELSGWSLWPDNKKHFNAQNSLKSVRVEDGKLKIKVFTENGKHYSAAISTENSFRAKYGRWEAKVKLNTPSGAYTDFWLYSRKMTDKKPSGHEIDIFEHRKVDSDNKDISDLIICGVHSNGYEENHSYEGYTTPNLNINNNWHIFGLEWNDKEYIFFIDGILIHKIKKTTDENLFPIFSVEVRNNFWCGPVLSEYNVDVLEVDWIRYYKKVEK